MILFCIIFIICFSAISFILLVHLLYQCYHKKWPYIKGGIHRTVMICLLSAFICLVSIKLILILIYFNAI